MRAWLRDIIAPESGLLRRCDHLEMRLHRAENAIRVLEAQLNAFSRRKS